MTTGRTKLRLILISICLLLAPMLFTACQAKKAEKPEGSQALKVNDSSQPATEENISLAGSAAVAEEIFNKTAAEDLEEILEEYCPPLEPNKDLLAEESEVDLAAEGKGRFIVAASTALEDAGENPYLIWLKIDFEADQELDAWALTEKLLTENGFAYAEEKEGGHLLKIIPAQNQKGQIELETAANNGANSAWLWSYNDISDLPAKDYVPKAGDIIRWYFTNDKLSPYNGHPEQYLSAEGNFVELNPTAKRPFDLSSSWPAFAGSMDHTAARYLDLDLAKMAAEELFIFKGEANGAGVFSDPVQVGEWIYLAFDDMLYQLNLDGTVANQALLQYPIDKTSRLAYADGLILVPIKYGKIQALTADELSTVWLADAPAQIILPDENSATMIPHPLQSLTSLKVVEDNIFQGLSTSGEDERSKGGVYRALDIEDGSTIWEYRSDKAGFYWSGGAFLREYLVVGNDLGEIFCFDFYSGELVDKMSLPGNGGTPAAIRSTMVSSESRAFFVSEQDGSVNRLQINCGGVFAALDRLPFTAGTSTASPTLFEGKVYLAGENTLAIVDLESFKLEESFAVDGMIRSTPLVIKDKNEKIYIFFTLEKEPGTIYALSVADGAIRTVYTPPAGLQSSFPSSVSISDDGTLYFSNDTGSFFAVKLIEMKEN